MALDQTLRSKGYNGKSKVTRIIWSKGCHRITLAGDAGRGHKKKLANSTSRRNYQIALECSGMMLF
ncbi:hypothetical protein BABINDRAFT_152187 [Babjeviella inositovora NRRL Y-12698]|uniref:Uncharacterized protein n=1 Tax=Babjeviella inositovora NRRL Y-12698 TaxID=984486 RepID=A0A1E3QLZ1_9ASCO|nr:uncharacterized protein BABINDRAFT_152187 [Babjeviella inositovora NRRL Y-12698]ODQ78701.1 hypothetical protein BABINDRAFT_152187 [Babjeviella inositovora NRRL Y-12698]